MKKVFLSFSILLFISMCLWAQTVPQTIDYQGRLADSDGNYLNSVVTVNFLIYNVETGGTALWNESQDVSMSNGIFHVQLGSLAAFPGTLFDSAVRWLELEVGGETLSPRTIVASVPYSIKSETAYSVEVPLNLTGNVSNPNSVIKGENTGTGYGVYGKHYVTDNYGYLGSDNFGVYGYSNFSGGYFEGDTYGVYGAANGFGVYGLHPSGNYGYIGSSDFGVFGSSSGNFGYLGSTTYGVYGNSSSDWAGYFDGKVHISDMVGIGTINPGRMLTVNSTGANPIQWQVNSLILGQLGTNGSGAGGLYLYDNGPIATVVTANGYTYFNGGNVGIGTDTPTSKLDVTGNVSYPNSVIKGVNTGTGYGVYGNSAGYYGGYFTSNYNSFDTHVIHAEFTGTGNDNAIAVYGKSRPADRWGYGGLFEGGRFGVYANVFPTGNNSYTGVRGYVYGGSGYNVAIDSYAYGSGTNIGINGFAVGGSTNYAGYFGGNVHVTGTFTNPSDERFKENVQPFKNALSKIRLMNVHTFNFIQMAEEKQMVLPEGEQIGLIAQELEEILPELVKDEVHAYDKNEGIEGAESDMEKIEYKGINYIGLIPVLIEAIKELQMQNEKQQRQIEELLRSANN